MGVLGAFAELSAFFLHSHDAWGLRSVSTEVSMAHINETNDDYFDEGADMGTAISMMHGDCDLSARFFLPFA